MIYFEGIKMNSIEEIINQIQPQKVIDKALKQGASYADIRFQQQSSELIKVENKSLEDYSSQTIGGLGIRVVINGAIGFASTSQFERKTVEQRINEAIKSAKAFDSQRGLFAEKETTKRDEEVSMKTNPMDVSPKEKVSLALETNKAAWISDAIKNVVTLIGSTTDFRYFLSSDGSETKLVVPTVGIYQLSIAASDGKMEQIANLGGECGGFEFFEKKDWNDFAVDVSELAIRTVKAKAPPAGTYPVIIDPELVGILTHEAFGHAAEADLVFTGTSTLKDRLGASLASDQVTIIDEGVIEGGYYIPFDDEGTEKTKTVILEQGVLKHYIHDLNTAKELGVKPTGNGRAQDFENIPLVRMTNTYIDAGNYSFEELLEGVKEGIYIKRKGSTGGQVEVGMGSFTFNAGESLMIRDGELVEPVRGVVLSGEILETLKTVDAVGKDLEISTGHFGACGKGSQRAKVGFGGPHIRVQEMTIGGR
ncbi:MAG: TldD/PmbA family protein [Candidatus Heimdallarchaeota archaeon]|nr:TldD/PmbA family protein [Candidatus Heimdallarchaeota archaeon]